MSEGRQLPPQGGFPTAVGRLGSIDALRGLDMWFITGGSAFLTALGYLITGRPETWISVQMCHVPWEGLRICDVIFPLFLFLSGVSFPFSLAKRRAEGATTGAILRHILVRTLVLVGWGLLCCRIQCWEWSTFRTWSVLGRVGIAWGVAATLWTLCRPRTCAIVTVGLLVAWWLFLSLIPSPDAAPGAWPMGAGGANARAIYLSQRLVDWAQISSFFMGAIPKLDVAPAWYGFCRATGALVVSWIALWFLYRRKVFIRI